MTSRRHAAAAAVGGGVLVAGWAAGIFGAAPPVYDGLPLTAEPYRYLQPPPGLATTAPPTSVTQTVTAAPPASASVLSIGTGESPPQASILVSSAGFAVPAATKVVLSITPVPPPAPVASGRIDGNVYRFAATSGGAPAALANGDTAANIELRASGARGTPVIERYDGAGWRRLATTHVPPDFYTTDVTALGDYALVLPPGAAPSGGPGTGAVAGIVVGAVLAVVGALLWLVRRSRRRPPTPPPAGGRRRRR